LGEKHPATVALIMRSVSPHDGFQGALRPSCECTLRMTPDAPHRASNRAYPESRRACTLRMMSPIKLIQFGPEVL